MESCITSQWSTDKTPQARLTVDLNTTSSDGDTAVLDWVLDYVAHGYAANTSYSKEYTVTINGTDVKSGTYSINGVTGEKTIATGSVNIAKGTSAKSISFGVSFAFNLTWSGKYGGTKTASGSISVPAKTTYTIRYNVNGGNGALDSQTKWHNTDLTLSSKKPTRTGHTFQGWALSKADADNNKWYYQPGGNCGRNENLTLYAVWEPHTYAVKYNANGGSLGNVTNQTKTYGVTLKLDADKPTRTNYNFLGWATSASATTVSYEAGANYTANAAATLYAVWELAYEKPVVIIESLDHTKITFRWSCTYYPSKGEVSWKSATDKYVVVLDTMQMGKSGSYTLDASGLLESDSTYTVIVEIEDSHGKNSASKTLPGTVFTIDCKAGGKGVAFGKAAELEPRSESGIGYADFGFEVCMNNSLRISARDLQGNIVEAFQPVNENGNTVVGWGNYHKKAGNTNIYGNTVNLRSNTGVDISDCGLFVDGCRVATNTVLWSGKYYMSESQTATLTESVSSQANGIVLVWSEYDITNSTAENANFNMCFVPKQFVKNHSGRGVGFIATSATLNVVANKYVYISDTSITGYADNNTSITEKDCGIKTTPNKFVLRYVIGV